jgi:hypothetical protein
VTKTKVLLLVTKNQGAAAGDGTAAGAWRSSQWDALIQNLYKELELHL